MARRSKKKIPWLLLGAAGLGAYFLFGSSASADEGAPLAPAGPGPSPGTPPSPQGTPAAGWKPGRYQVTTQDTGPIGDLMLRDQPSTNGNIVERLPHGSYVMASNVTNNGFAAVMAPSQKTGWASMMYLTFVSAS